MNSTMWKIAPRRLARDQAYSLINVAGLPPAIACYPILGGGGTFAYRTSSNPGVFVLAALAGLRIAYVTVAMRSLRAARAHAVRALREE